MKKNFNIISAVKLFVVSLELTLISTILLACCLFDIPEYLVEIFTFISAILLMFASIFEILSIIQPRAENVWFKICFASAISSILCSIFVESLVFIPDIPEIVVSILSILTLASQFLVLFSFLFAVEYANEHNGKEKYVKKAKQKEILFLVLESLYVVIYALQSFEVFTEQTVLTVMGVLLIVLTFVAHFVHVDFMKDSYRALTGKKLKK